MADVPVSALPQTHVTQLEATIQSAHALLQAELTDVRRNVDGAFHNEVIPKRVD